MATKRKAKTPEKAEAQHVGFFPVATQALTPKAAARWLEQDAPLFHELVQEALQVADREERKALAWFAYYLGQVIQGAARAVAHGKPVRFQGDRDSSAIESLALVLRAASRISSEGAPEELEVLAPAVHTITTRIVCLAREAVAEEAKQRKAEWEKKDRERLATDPKYRAYQESFERFRKAGDEAAAAGRAAQGSA